MPRDHRTRALLIHASAYAVVVAICAAVNLWFAPNTLWFVWVALGWGIGVAAHALAFWLRHKRRRERVFIDCKARGATVHLFAYVATILLLFAVNLIATPNVWWFYWVALGWGAGVAAHVWCAFLRKRAPRTEVKSAPVTKRAAPKKKTTSQRRATKR